MAGVFSLAELSRSARIAEPYVRGLVAQGLSANKIQLALKGTQLAVRRTELLRLVRGLKDIQAGQLAFTHTRLHFLPDPNKFPIAPFEFDTNYSFGVKFSGFHATTGERSTLFVTIRTDSLLTKAEIIDAATQLVEADPSMYPIIVQEAQAFNPLRNPLRFPS